jgi:hypothetical protein
MPGKWQFLFFAVLLALSGISWVIRKLQEQSKARSQLQDRERRKLEYLRTGRDPGAEETFGAPVSPAEAQTRLRELAAKRQAQLRALREQQSRRGAPAAPAPTSVPPLQQRPAKPVRAELWPGGPVIEVAPKPKPPARPVPVTRPIAPKRAAPAAATAKPAPQRPASQQSGAQMIEAHAAKQVRDAGKLARARQVVAQTEREEAVERQKRRSVAAAKALQPEEIDEYTILGAAPPIYVAPTTVAEWRTAFIAAEVLGTPLGSRDEAHVPGLML